MGHLLACPHQASSDGQRVTGDCFQLVSFYCFLSNLVWWSPAGSRWTGVCITERRQQLTLICTPINCLSSFAGSGGVPSKQTRHAGEAVHGNWCSGAQPYLGYRKNNEEKLRKQCCIVKIVFLSTAFSKKQPWIYN